jgi:hypothetical protein
MTAAAIAAFSPDQKLTVADGNKMLDLLLHASIRFPLDDMLESMPPAAWSDLPTVRKLAKAITLSQDYDMDPSFGVKLLWDALLVFPKEEALLYPVATASLSHEMSAKQLRQLVSVADSLSEVTNEFAVQAIATLRLVDGEGFGLERNVDMILANTGVGTQLPQLLLDSDAIPIEKRLTILSLIIRKSRETGSGQWREFVTPIRRALDSRKSGFTKSDVWMKLDLPAESHSVLLPVTSAGDALERN